jgi:predicted ATPase
MKSVYDIASRSGWNVYTEIVRDIIKETGLKHSDKAEPRLQQLIAEKMMQNYLFCAKSNISFLTDRCIIDNAAYTDWMVAHGEFPKETLAVCDSLFDLLYDQYDIIFYCEPVPLKDDGVRNTDPQYQDEMVECFRKRLDRVREGRKVVCTLGGSVEERLEKFKKVCLWHGLAEEIESGINPLSQQRLIFNK